MSKAEILALGVLLALPILAAALRRWWPEISAPLQSRDDAERHIAKGSVLIIFVACLLYAGLGTLGAVLHGKVGLAVFSASIGWWVWEGLTEVERRYHLLEAVELGIW